MKPRKKPLARGTKPLKRTRLAPVSKKRAKLNAAVKGPREDYKLAHPHCMVCGGRTVDVHELCAGPARVKAIEHAYTWLTVCRGPGTNDCHEWLHDANAWPLARALAVKLLNDSDNFDLVAVNVLRGRDESAITMADVVRHLQLLEV